MPTDCISYQNSGIFLLMNDYLDQKQFTLLYNLLPTIENFEGQILEKQANMMIRIESLVSVLQNNMLLLKLHLTQKY
jgi:hypothetical protein